MRKYVCMGTALALAALCCLVTMNVAPAEEPTAAELPKVVSPVMPNVGTGLDEGTPPGGTRALGDTCTVGLGINCQIPDLGGHGSDGIIGATSTTDTGYKVQENFVPAADGNVTTLCWWGVYLDFNVPEECFPGVPRRIS